MAKTEIDQVGWKIANRLKDDFEAVRESRDIWRSLAMKSHDLLTEAEMKLSAIQAGTEPDEEINHPETGE